MVVHIGSGQPELRAELAELPVRARAERLRQLALVGLYSLRCGPPATVPVSEPHSAPDGAATARRDRLLHRLLQATD